jgi:hypothetical protein
MREAASPRDSKTNNSAKVSKKLHESVELDSATEIARADARVREVSQLEYDMLSDYLVAELT